MRWKRWFRTRKRCWIFAVLFLQFLALLFYFRTVPSEKEHNAHVDKTKDGSAHDVSLTINAAPLSEEFVRRFKMAEMGFKAHILFSDRQSGQIGQNEQIDKNVEMEKILHNVDIIDTEEFSEDEDDLETRQEQKKQRVFGSLKSNHNRSSLDTLKNILESQNQARPKRESSTSSNIPRHRIVHLDLKGAAPKFSFFDPFFALISKQLGATGILIEWEDMFPFRGPLQSIRSPNAYSESQIRGILASAKRHNLLVIPLVQTFGHLEWLLKHQKFAHFREVPRYPQMICPQKADAVELVKETIDQVLTLHDDAKLIHIGMDEAFQVGMCRKCFEFVTNQLGGSRERLVLMHMKSMAEHIKGKNRNMRVLIWHDMLVGYDARTMRSFKLGDLVEPVFWAYEEDLNQALSEDFWTPFVEVFPFAWAASAFKGADGPDRYYSNVPHYLKNHVSWLRLMSDVRDKFADFRGIVLTGWQRFDHFAVLCELLPVGLPSLAVNLLVMKAGAFNPRTTIATASDSLGCSKTLPLLSQNNSALSQDIFCSFPGFKIYQLVEQLKERKNEVTEQVFNFFKTRGWLSTNQHHNNNLAHNYKTQWFLEQLVERARKYEDKLQTIAHNLRREMLAIYYQDTIDEFIEQYISSDIERIHKLLAAAKQSSVNEPHQLNY